MRMNEALLPLLPSLLALIEEAGVGRAAKRMGISQPRMSARLATLRTLLDDPVLVPAAGTRRFIPTDRARRMADAVGRTLTDLDAALEGDHFDAATDRRTFSIMANDNAAAIAGLPLIDAIAHAAGPGVRCALHQFAPSRLGELESGKLDLALGSPRQFQDTPGLMSRTIIRDRFVSAVRSGTPPATDLDSFCARDHVLVSGEGGGFAGTVDQALAAQGMSRRVRVSVQSYLLAIEAVAASDMIATLPKALLMANHQQLAVFAAPVALPPFTLIAAWHPRVDRDPSHRWLRHHLGVVHHD